ncbi:hypothetical protein LIER_36368 [Lithospermum erythrorhizon]|uniref:Secreted protein n=1 Tax=Lithospermum erythrorhizon TaxID=34254 RepID=A0AAV3P7N8_LITER
MEKLIGFVVLLLIANQRPQFSEGQLNPIPNPPPFTIPPRGGYQCYGDCRVNQQEDCNPGCMCRRLWQGTRRGICLWDGNPPPLTCLSHHDCAKQDGKGRCFKPNGSEYGLCLPKDVSQ